MFETKTLRFAFDRHNRRWRSDTPRQRNLGLSTTGKLSVHEIRNIPQWMTREEVARNLPRRELDSHLDFSLRHSW
ncbi:hypothetical protein BST81_03395 [Leptolyngbya sp. 'hensonii']|uniref:hypothetical protein n=1 Tax=Leptolyngbya sp. 'hensonii' TaxID=1922337 RepID=UPI00094F8A4A|nr:hypothetical protein [Leptolyngbya sp. 'hensonii']OLP19831.1 hypothetical protein BST81_03395 [Leptolyngbya sp. 'hensonii']